MDRPDGLAVASRMLALSSRRAGAWWSLWSLAVTLVVGCGDPATPDDRPPRWEKYAAEDEKKYAGEKEQRKLDRGSTRSDAGSGDEQRFDADESDDDGEMHSGSSKRSRINNEDDDEDMDSNNEHNEEHDDDVDD